MIPISINTDEFQEAFNIPPEDIQIFIDNVISELSTQYALLWGREANSLKSSRIEYKNSIYTKRISNSKYIVGLRGFLPNAVESGLSGFDMKAGFKRSSKAIHKPGGGWYLTIPYRFATTGSIGESSLFSSILPSEVYKVAKKQSVGTGLNIGNVPQQFAIPKTRKSVITKSKVFEEYQNKFSIYSGIQKKKDQTGRGTYVSFRRVSENSDPDSWIHSGISERNLAEKAIGKMDIASTVDNLAEKYIEEL